MLSCVSQLDLGRRRVATTSKGNGSDALGLFDHPLASKCHSQRFLLYLFLHVETKRRTWIDGE